jgi:hypothetical protein
MSKLALRRESGDKNQTAPRSGDDEFPSKTAKFIRFQGIFFDFQGTILQFQRTMFGFQRPFMSAV